MPKLEVSRFDGIIPRTGATELGPNQAQTASNAKLYSEELRSWLGPTLQFKPAISGVKSIYKYYYSTTSYYWLTWTGDVDVVPSPAIQQGDYRIYYTGDGKPKKTNLSMVASGSGAYPESWLYMGVPNPTIAPSTSVVGTDLDVPPQDSQTDVVYVFTYISQFGPVAEESGPSPASAIVQYATNGQNPALTFTDAPPSTGYNITKRRVYRSVSGSTATNYQFVADVPIGTNTYSDTLTAAQLGSVLLTNGWLPPPDNASGLMAHPSGSLICFAGNTVYMSDTTSVHAFPLAYQINVPYNIVGLGLWGTSIVIMTDKFPYMLSGQLPGAMSLQIVQVPEPCVSKRSIASDADGVIYASPNGLVGIGPNVQGVFTESIFRRTEWQSFSPSNIFGVLADNKYFGVYPAAANVQTMVIDRDDIPKLSLLNIQASAVHVDRYNGQLYYLNSADGYIYALDQDTLNPLTYTWTSKRFVYPASVSWSAMKIDGDYSSIISSQNYAAALASLITANQATFAAHTNLMGALNETPVNTFCVDGSLLSPLPEANTVLNLTVMIYADDTLVQTINMSAFDPLRLAPFKCRDFYFTLTGTLNVRSVLFATTVEELRS